MESELSTLHKLRRTEELFSTQLVRAVLPQLKRWGRLWTYFLDRKILNRLLANWTQHVLKGHRFQPKGVYFRNTRLVWSSEAQNCKNIRPRCFFRPCSQGPGQGNKVIKRNKRQRRKDVWLCVLKTSSNLRTNLLNHIIKCARGASENANTHKTSAA